MFLSEQGHKNNTNGSLATLPNKVGRVTSDPKVGRVTSDPLTGIDICKYTTPKAKITMEKTTIWRCSPIQKKVIFHCHVSMQGGIYANEHIFPDNPGDFTTSPLLHWLPGYRTVVAPRKNGAKNQDSGHHWAEQSRIIPTGWWFQPLWKILVKMGIFPRPR